MVDIPTVHGAICSDDLVLRPEQDVLEAISELVTRNIPGAPVTDSDGRLVGMLTVKDCLRIISGAAFGDMVGGDVAGHMSEIKGVLEPDMDLFRAVHVFLQSHFPVLPVLNEGRLIGCVRRMDLLQQIHELDRSVQADREREASDQEAWKHPTSIDRLQKLAARFTRS